MSARDDWISLISGLLFSDKDKLISFQNYFSLKKNISKDIYHPKIDLYLL